MDLDALLAAVASLLNTPAVLPGTAAVVDYTPDAGLDELATKRLIVAPGYGADASPLVEEPAGRGVHQFTARIAVALQQKLTEPTLEVPNLLTDFASVRARLRGTNPPDLPSAKWRGTEVVAAPSPDHLRNKRVFLAVAIAQYELLG